VRAYCPRKRLQAIWLHDEHRKNIKTVPCGPDEYIKLNILTSKRTCVIIIGLGLFPYIRNQFKVLSYRYVVELCKSATRIKVDTKVGLENP
jgi:hypothetical protein